LLEGLGRVLLLDQAPRRVLVVHVGHVLERGQLDHLAGRHVHRSGQHELGLGLDDDLAHVERVREAGNDVRAILHFYLLVVLFLKLRFSLKSSSYLKDLRELTGEIRSKNIEKVGLAVDVDLGHGEVGVGADRLAELGAGVLHPVAGDHDGLGTSIQELGRGLILLLQGDERLELALGALGPCLEQVVLFLVLGIDHFERESVQDLAHLADRCLDCLRTGLHLMHHDLYLLSGCFPEF